MERVWRRESCNHYHLLLYVFLTRKQGQQQLSVQTSIMTYAQTITMGMKPSIRSVSSLCIYCLLMCDIEVQIHRIKSWNISKFEGTIRIIKYSPYFLQNNLRLNHMTKSSIQMLLELWQAQCSNNFPREPVLVIDHPPNEEPFLNAQPKLPLTQLNTIPLCSISAQQRQDQHRPSAAPLEEFVDCNEVSPQPSPPSCTNRVISAASHKSCP